MSWNKPEMYCNLYAIKVNRRTLSTRKDAQRQCWNKNLQIIKLSITGENDNSWKKIIASQITGV